MPGTASVGNDEDSRASGSDANLPARSNPPPLRIVTGAVSTGGR